MKSKHRFLSVLLCLVLLVSLAVPAAAEETGTRLEVSAPGSVYPGNSVTVYLTLREPDSLAVLDFELYYDSALLTLNSASVHSSLSGSSSVNTSTAGVVRASVMKMDGIQEELQVLTLSFRVASGAPAGSIPLALAIGDAYRANLSAIDVRGVSGAITVRESSPSKPRMYVYSQATPSSLKQGNVTEIRYYTYGTNGFASGVFDLRYDETLFAFDSFEVGAALEGGISSVNSRNPGQVRLAYASNVPVASSGTLFTLRLRATADVTAQTTVTLEAQDLNTESLQDMQPISVTVNLSLTELPPPPADYPDFLITAPERAPQGGDFDLILSVKGESALAAGDFTLTYDPALFEIVSEPAAAPELTAAGGMVMVNPNYGEGTVKFSFILESGVLEDQPMLVVPMRAIGAIDSTGTFSASGRSLYDADYHVVYLDYPEAATEIYCSHPSTTTTYAAPTCTEPGYTGDEICTVCGETLHTGEEIPALGHDYKAVVTEPTCTEAGYTTYTCTRCGESYVDDPVEALGHAWDDGVVTAPAICTEDGVMTYTCAHDASHTRTEVISALGHDYKAVVTEPTCTEPGHTTYTCTRCGDSYEADPVEALGHDYKAVVTEPTCTEAGYTTYTCTRCGDSYVGDQVEALGHDYKAVVTEPTCTEAGYTTYICTRCGDVHVDSYVDALGHSWDEGVVTLEPTETSEGEKTFTCTRCGETRTEAIPVLEPSQTNPFTDVPEGKYYTDAVLWAISQDPKITTGVTPTTFMPDRICTRAHVVTFLWRANGCPEPSNLNSNFKDVKDTSKYYYKAVLWAAEQGITTGYSDGTFRPDDECTRGQVVTFLWRAKGQPMPASTTNPFSDVANDKYYTTAILWALENNITTGRTPTTFGPDDACTRGHVVTFLYRAYA